jgi:hypothetical protein
MASPDPVRATRIEWEKALTAQKSRLRKKRYAGLLRSLDYDSFVAEINKEDQRYRQRHIARYMESLSPALKHLEAFVRAFTTMASANPEIAGLVWGGLQIVLVVRKHELSSSSSAETRVLSSSYK